MIGANGSVRGKKEFEPSSLAAESESLLGPHLEDYWSHRFVMHHKAVASTMLYTREITLRCNQNV